MKGYVIIINKLQQHLSQSLKSIREIKLGFFQPQRSALTTTQWDTPYYTVTLTAVTLVILKTNIKIKLFLGRKNLSCSSNIFI